MSSTPERPPYVTIVASLTEPPDADGDQLRALSAYANCLEVRADLVGDLDVDWLRERFAGRLLYTLRSEAEFGRGTTDPKRRAERLIAARGYDLVDLEAERDLGSSVLNALDPYQRVISWHGRSVNPHALRRRWKYMSALAPARLYKLVTTPERSGEELAPLELLLDIGATDIAAFAMGAIGMWTRQVAPRLGAPWIYCAAGSLVAAPGQQTAERAAADYGLPSLHRASKLFGVVGHPATHSLSPRLHNAGYRSGGVDALYVPFEAPCFETFWREVAESDFFDRAGLPLSGLSVTAPHKAAALAAAAEASELAVRTGSANTLLPVRGKGGERRWRAESTDPEGVSGPLRRRGVQLAGRAAVVLGAGGAGRAAVAGLMDAGAEVALANRTETTGRAAAAALGAAFMPLDELSPGTFDVVVNATSLGHDAADPFPCDPDAVRASAVAVEMVYGSGATPWALALEERGVPVVDGREVLLHQGLAQFEAMTGKPLPFEVGAAALGLDALGLGDGR